MQFFPKHLRHIHLLTNPLLHPRNQDMKPGFGPGRGFRPTKTSALSPTSTNGPDFPLNQHLQPIFKNKLNGSRIISIKITSYTTLFGDCDLDRLLPLLHNINLQNDALLDLNNFYNEIYLSLTASIKKVYEPIILDFHKVDPTTLLFDYLVPYETSTNRPHAY